ncbi:MAG: nucleotidyltransferase family protein [Armatimonadetes bacterium]|nr:nucleotidyltransferase family protein [Armatimonadota bacterium]
MKCVVLAGGVNRRELYPGYRPGFKATVEIHRRPLLSYVLEALESATGIEEVAIVGDRAALEPIAGGTRRFLTPGETLVESIKSALGAFPDEDRVLLCTADLPMLRGEMVDRFLEDCPDDRPGYRDHLFLSMVPAASFVGLFASCRKNFNRFRDVAVCHGNLALASPTILENREAMSRIDQIYAARTSPVASALAIGPALGLAYVLGVHFFPLLRLETFTAMLSRRFSIGMRAVFQRFPEIAVDIDEPADYHIAIEVLRS